MKKVFSTVAMAIVAVASVVSMASCSNDSPSSFNPAPSVSTKTVNEQKAADNSATTLKNLYKATITNDVFALYDVTLVRTIGSEAKTYTFANATDMEKAMSVDDKFEAPKGTKVSFKATFKVKDNYQETLAKFDADNTDKTKADVCLKVYPNFSIQSLKTLKTRNSCLGGTFWTKNLTKEHLETLAELWTSGLSVDNE